MPQRQHTEYITMVNIMPKRPNRMPQRQHIEYATMVNKMPQREHKKYVIMANTMPQKPNRRPQRHPINYHVYDMICLNSHHVRFTYHRLSVTA